MTIFDKKTAKIKIISLSSPIKWRFKEFDNQYPICQQIGTKIQQFNLL
jgi:hypothetical protein